MLTARMLVILYGLDSADAAVACALEALSACASPYGVRFAVPEPYADAFAELYSAGEALRPGDIKPYDEGLGLAAIPPLLGDETHFLFLMGAYGFADRWDAELYERLKKTPDRAALLTGHISAASEGLPAQAYLPGFGAEFGVEGVSLSRGLPLVLSAAPVRTLAVDPALLFGTVDFLRRVPLELDALSLSAYMAAYPVYALDRAPLWPQKTLPTRKLRRATDALPGTTLARFEQQAGFRFDQERAGVKTNWGLFFNDNAYPQTLPTVLKARGRVRTLISRARESGSDLPLMVTAFKELSHPIKPLPLYMLRFGFLKDIQSLPLILYTGGSQERYLRTVFPNAWSYPDRYVLPLELLSRGMTSEQHFKRSKPYLLLRALEKHPEFTHVVWANIDLIKHPVCPDAVPDLSALMDDRVHMATVNAIPDASFYIVPAELVEPLTRETRAITLMDADMKRSFAEEPLWQRLAQRFPRHFTFHPMPKKHLLMLTAFDPRLLSQPTRALLSDLLPPWRA